MVTFYTVIAYIGGDFYSFADGIPVYRIAEGICGRRLALYG